MKRKDSRSSLKHEYFVEDPRKPSESCRACGVPIWVTHFHLQGQDDHRIPGFSWGQQLPQELNSHKTQAQGRGGRGSATSPRAGEVKSKIKKPNHRLPAMASHTQIATAAPAALPGCSRCLGLCSSCPLPPFSSPRGDTEPWLLPHYSLTPPSRTSGRDKVLLHPFEPCECRFPPRAGAAGPKPLLQFFLAVACPRVWKKPARSPGRGDPAGDRWDAGTVGRGAENQLSCKNGFEKSFWTTNGKREALIFLRHVGWDG